ncbi:MAG: hypothetical protein DDG59_00735 [Anaerolineae bacterium]|jgi:hypothetical protein|nr:MAG: hypothetical protein DDG59_00735 [Anaerolineae bacterium]
MPTLSQSLSKTDLGFLRILARFWGIDIPLRDKKTAIQHLSAWLSDPPNLHKVLQTLPHHARLAFEDLLSHQGRLPLAVFTRKYGEIRQVGAGKRDREAIYLSPQNPSEILSFHGLIYQDFLEGERGIEEFVYIPSELLAILPAAAATQAFPYEAFANPEQVVSMGATQDALVDDACTCLAWLRLDKTAAHRLAELRKHFLLAQAHQKGLPIPLKPEFLIAILSEAAILDSSSSPIPEATRTFLYLPRLKALQVLFNTWLRSTAINELKQLEHLECLGEWENDPIATRHFIIEQLQSLCSADWYELDSFIKAIHDHFPDFQRPAGNYEVWLIRRRNDGTFLQGFDSWFSVEGELLRYLISGPLVWLGIIELGTLKNDRSPTVFRLTPIGEAFLQNQIPSDEESPEDKLQVLSSGVIAIPRRFSLPLRYQIARFCVWEGYQNEQYLYRITPSSLKRAQQNGLNAQHLARLLQRAAANLPPTLIRALRRWITNDTEIEVQRISLLRVRSPEILEKIKRSPCSKYVQQVLNPTTAVIAQGKEKKLVEQLLTLGFLAEVEAPPLQEPH